MVNYRTCFVFLWFILTSLLGLKVFNSLKCLGYSNHFLTAASNPIPMTKKTTFVEKINPFKHLCFEQHIFSLIFLFFSLFVNSTTGWSALSRFNY